MDTRLLRALLLFVLLLAGCVDGGWYEPRDIAGTGTLFGVSDDDDSAADDDATGDDDDATGDDDDATGDDDDATGDDDDATGDDDDATGDDDDATGDDDDAADDDDATGDDDDAADDDDATGDDDDSVGDDDDSVGDDDDATFAGADVVVTVNMTDFGVVAPGTQGVATVTIENQGGALAFVNVTLSSPIQQGQFVYALTGGNTVFAVYSGATQTRYVEFTPPVGLAAATYATDLDVDWGGPNGSEEFTFSAQTGLVGEGSCTDGLDGDSDGDIDCDDADCGADPACATVDFCCSPGDSNTNGFCWDPAAASCACAADSWCCSGGWDATCVAAYQGCGATSCGP